VHDHALMVGAARHGVGQWADIWADPHNPEFTRVRASEGDKIQWPSAQAAMKRLREVSSAINAEIRRVAKKKAVSSGAVPEKGNLPRRRAVLKPSPQRIASRIRTVIPQRFEAGVDRIADNDDDDDEDGNRIHDVLHSDDGRSDDNDDGDVGSSKSDWDNASERHLDEHINLDNSSTPADPYGENNVDDEDDEELEIEIEEEDDVEDEDGGSAAAEALLGHDDAYERGSGHGVGEEDADEDVDDDDIEESNESE
jgi:hypothetical protein